MYHGDMKRTTRAPSLRPAAAPELTIERVQTGVRIEKRLLKVLKALADYHDLSLGDLLEGIVLHAFEGKPAFSDESRKKIAELKRVFHLDLDAASSHRLREKES
jgi:hypothetical protein